MRFVIIENGVVEDAVKGSDPLFPNWIASESAAIGDLYDEATGEFTRPGIPKPQAFEQKAEELKEVSEERIAAGAPHNGVRWPADFRSQMAKASVAASVGAGRGMPRNQANIMARDINRQQYEMTETEYLDMASAIRDYVFEVMENAEQHTDALLALLADDTKTADDIAAHDVTAGWPA